MTDLLLIILLSAMFFITGIFVGYFYRLHGEFKESMKELDRQSFKIEVKNDIMRELRKQEKP